MSGWSILSEHRGKKKNYANNEKKKKITIAQEIFCSINELFPFEQELKTAHLSTIAYNVQQRTLSSFLTTSLN